MSGWAVGGGGTGCEWVMPVGLFVCLSVFSISLFSFSSVFFSVFSLIFIRLFFFSSSVFIFFLCIYLFIQLLGLVQLSIHLSVCLVVCLSICLSICLSVCLYLSVCLSICLSVCLYLSVCLLLSFCPPARKKGHSKRHKLCWEETKG